MLKHIMEEWILCTLAFLLVAGLMPLAAWAAPYLGLMDMPGARRVHEVATPRIGGLVIFPVVLGLVAVSGGFDAPSYAAFALLLLVGALDDHTDVRPLWKFGAQGIAALLIVFWGDVRIEHLGNFFGFGSVELGLWAVPLTLICIVLLINAINMADGLDGLAAGFGIVALIFLGENMVLIGALAGFLMWNMRTPWRKRAYVFLGDAGSMALGLALAIIAIHAAQNADLRPITVAWVLALPIMDAAAQIARRTAAGKNPMTADRGHLHHRLMDRGFTQEQTVIILILIASGLAVIGFLPVPEWILVVMWTALCLSHVGYNFLRSQKA